MLSAKYSNYLICFIILSSLLISCKNNSNSTQNESKDDFDWKSFLSRPYLSVSIYDQAIFIRAYHTSFDTTTYIDSFSILLTSEDSSLLLDSSWINCQYTKGNSWSGKPILKHEKQESPYPTSIIILYRLNYDVNLIDTIVISDIVNFIESVTITQATKSSSNFIYKLNWNLNELGIMYAPYITIAIDNGLVGAEYYESYPNFDNLPEAPQPPEGYSTKYARFKPENNYFVFTSNQNMLPFLRITNTVKQYPQFDIRISSTISN